MHKKWILLVLSVLTSALCAQSKQNLDKEDVLAAFQQYNPSALQKADENATYGNILNKLAAAYQTPNTIENKIELIALVKNFDNSLQLYALSHAYNESRTLQTASGVSMDTLEQDTRQAIVPILQDVYQNTLDVKKIQIKEYQQQIKEIKKSSELSAEQKKEQINAWKNRVKATKQEIRSLKKNAQINIQNTADRYVKEMSANYEKAQAQQLQALQAASNDVKAKNKKPVAK